MANDQPAHADPSCRSSPSMLARLAAMMFLQYWPLGIWGVTYCTYIAANTGQQGTGIFSAGFAGYSTAAGAIGSLLSPVIVGFLSDRYFAAQRLVALMHVVCALAAWRMYESQTQTEFFLWLAVYFQCFSPAAALTNKIGLRHLASADREYPRVRVFATVGWISAGIFVGFAWPRVTGESIEASRIPLSIGACGSVIMAFYSLTLPNTPPEERSGVLRRRIWQDSGELFRNQPLVTFLFVSMLACIPSMAYNNHGNLFLNQQEYSSPAALMTLGQVSDVLVLWVTPSLIARFGLRRLFISGVIAWGLRYISLAAGSYYGIAWPVIAAILLNGPCFVFIYVIGILYVDHLVRGEHRGAAQGMFAVASAGLGHLLGALSVGFTQAMFLTPENVKPPPYHWTAFWSVPAVVSVATFLVFKVAFKPPRHLHEQGAK